MTTMKNKQTPQNIWLQHLLTQIEQTGATYADISTDHQRQGQPKGWVPTGASAGLKQLVGTQPDWFPTETADTIIRKFLSLNTASEHSQQFLGLVRLLTLDFLFGAVSDPVFNQVLEHSVGKAVWFSPDTFFHKSLSATQAALACPAVLKRLPQNTVHQLTHSPSDRVRISLAVNPGLSRSDRLAVLTTTDVTEPTDPYVQEIVEKCPSFDYPGLGDILKKMDPTPEEARELLTSPIEGVAAAAHQYVFTTDDPLPYQQTVEILREYQTNLEIWEQRSTTFWDQSPRRYNTLVRWFRTQTVRHPQHGIIPCRRFQPALPRNAGKAQKRVLWKQTADQMVNMSYDPDELNNARLRHIGSSGPLRWADQLRKYPEIVGHPELWVRAVNLVALELLTRADRHGWNWDNIEELSETVLDPAKPGWKPEELLTALAASDRNTGVWCPPEIGEPSNWEVVAAFLIQKFGYWDGYEQHLLQTLPENYRLSETELHHTSQWFPTETWLTAIQSRADAGTVLNRCPVDVDQYLQDRHPLLALPVLIEATRPGGGCEELTLSEACATLT